jgi:hypothetical protein
MRRFRGKQSGAFEAAMKNAPHPDAGHQQANRSKRASHGVGTFCV